MHEETEAELAPADEVPGEYYDGASDPGSNLYHSETELESDGELVIVPV